MDRARACGLDRCGGACQLTDELLAAVIAGVRPSRPNGKSQAWETIDAQAEQITAWLKQGLTLTKVHTLLGCRGVVVSYRTLHRYATTELGLGQRQATVPVADCEPGSELQVDFGRLGLHTDAEDGRQRVVHGLIFTAVYCADADLRRHPGRLHRRHRPQIAVAYGLTPPRVYQIRDGRR